MPNRSALIGGMEIVALADAVPAPVSPDWPFPDVPVEAWAGLSDGSLDGGGRFHPNLGCFLIRWGGRAILVDAGIGPGPNAYLNGIRGSLPERLAEAGAGFEAIDAVVFTHLHMDHVGWAALPDAGGAQRPAMPDTPHFVAAAELDFWLGQSKRAGHHHHLAFDNCIRPLIRDGLIQTVAPGQEFLPDISLLALPGHTPGHSAVVLAQAAETAVIGGDVLHCPAQVANPDWCHRADLDRPQARASRMRFIEAVAAGGWTMCAGHFRDPVVFGTIERNGDGFRHVAARST